MNKNFIFAAVCSLILLSGCATMSASDKTYYQQAANSPIYCSDADDCEVKWGRAILWVSQNSHWKIRNQSDSLITTEGPFDTVYAAYSINKVPLGKGNYQIMMRAGCGNPFGCVPSTLQLKANFVESVSPESIKTYDNYTSCSTDLGDTVSLDQSEVTEISPKSLTVKYDSIKVYAEPGFNSTPITSSEKGSTLTALAENSGWYKVKVEDKKSGWVAKNWVIATEK